MSARGSKRIKDSDGSDFDFNTSQDLGVSRSGRQRKKSSRFLEIEDTMDPVTGKLKASERPQPVTEKSEESVLKTFLELPHPQPLQPPVQESVGGTAKKHTKVLTAKKIPDTQPHGDLKLKLHLGGSPSVEQVSTEPVKKSRKKSRKEHKTPYLDIEIPSDKPEPYMAVREEGLKMKLILSPKDLSSDGTASGVGSEGVASPRKKKSSKRSRVEGASDEARGGGVLTDSDFSKTLNEMDALVDQTGNIKQGKSDAKAPAASYIDFINEIASIPPTVKQASPAKAKKKKKKVLVETPGEEVHSVSSTDTPLTNYEQEVKGVPPPKTKKPAKEKVTIESGLEGVSQGAIPKQSKEDKLSTKAEKQRIIKEKREEARKKKEEKARKRPPTAYTLWTSSYRHKILAKNSELDFASVSKRLGEIWHSLPEKEKKGWKRKAKKLASKATPWKSYFGSYAMNAQSHSQPKGVTLTKVSQGRKTSQSVRISPSSRTKSTLKLRQKTSKLDIVDIAAHMKLLSESLSLIGVRLQQHRGQIAVQGSMSVLLDSMICALGPLMCLTGHVPELDGCPINVHSETLDNIAYIMPGL